MEDLYQYMKWGNYDQRINELADIVLDEPWSFQGREDNSILKNYLKYTFARLQEENKIMSTDTQCWFNTGLFTPYYEQVFVYGEVNPDSKKPDWIFKGFLTEYELGSLGINILPERADYFFDPVLLVFDWHCPINVQYQHILQDDKNYNRLPDIVTKSAYPFNILRGSIDTSIRRVMANYKLAVPQYFNQTIQLLLPLYFTNTDKPDLALVISKYSGGYYQGHTCLTMEMAYNNARLIARPESNWLVP